MFNFALIKLLFGNKGCSKYGKTRLHFFLQALVTSIKLNTFYKNNKNRSFLKNSFKTQISVIKCRFNLIIPFSRTIGFIASQIIAVIILKLNHIYQATSTVM